MTPIERIDLYLNKQLSAAEVAELERDLQRHPDLQMLLDSVEMTRRTVRTRTIEAAVRRVHQRFMPEYRRLPRSYGDVDEPGAGTPAGRSIPLRNRSAIRWADYRGQPLRWLVQLTVAVLFVLVGYGGYQFVTLDRQALYDEKFVAYQLPTTRDGNALPTALDSLYRAGNYAAVVQRGAALSPQQRQPQPYFLTAMAYLNLRQYDAALGQFRALRALNRQNATPYFEQETDYYEALAELAVGDYERAYTGLERIYNNPRHLFHGNVSRVDLWKTKLLAYR